MDIAKASERISPYINNTPILKSSLLNEWLGHDIYFKHEGTQKIGAFKARGALNTLLSLKEKGELPDRVVAYSSGNHAQAVAWASGIVGIKATIYIPSFASEIKKQATRSYGAEIVETDTRQEAERLGAEEMDNGAFLLPPYDHDDVICGQGTACFEALNEMTDKPQAVFAPCGGGGLISGTLLATKLLSPESEIYAGEPEIANDAHISYKTGRIVRLNDTPPTIADGVRTLSISERTLKYIKQLDGFYEVSEDEIIYWTQWLTHLLKVTIEPTSAISMASAAKWLRTQNSQQKILLILSGGNISADTYRQIWAKDYINNQPSLSFNI